MAGLKNIIDSVACGSNGAATLGDVTLCTSQGTLAHYLASHKDGEDPSASIRSVTMIKTISAIAAVAITTSAIAFSVAANAQGPVNTEHKALTAAGTTDCERAVWPAYGQGCLLTIDGDKSDRKFRVVGS